MRHTRYLSTLHQWAAAAGLLMALCAPAGVGAQTAAPTTLLGTSPRGLTDLPAQRPPLNPPAAVGLPGAVPAAVPPAAAGGPAGSGPRPIAAALPPDPARR